MDFTRRSFLLASSTFLIARALDPASSQAQDAVTLALKFREGQVFKYSYQEIMAYVPPAKFFGVSGWTLDCKTDYTITVTRVGDDGVANVKFRFNRVTILKDGAQIADMTVFARKGEEVSATIKANGETRFYKNFYIAINTGNQLEYRISTGGGVMATGTTSSEGSEKIDFAADLDEGEGIIKVGLPPTRNPENADFAKLTEFKLDLTPRKLFNLLTLPTVPLAVGQSFSVPVKYIGKETLKYSGQADDAGFAGALVEADVTPWTETSSTPGAIQPTVSGSLRYLIDNAGKLARSSGKLRTEILIPEIGVQVVDTKIELTLKK